MDKKMHETPTNHAKVLEVLRVLGTATSRDVVDATGLSKRAVSVAIGKLVEKELLQREAQGFVSVTEKGRQ